MPQDWSLYITELEASCTGPARACARWGSQTWEEMWRTRIPNPPLATVLNDKSSFLQWTESSTHNQHRAKPVGFSCVCLFVFFVCLFGFLYVLEILFFNLNVLSFSFCFLYSNEKEKPRVYAPEWVEKWRNLEGVRGEEPQSKYNE